MTNSWHKNKATHKNPMGGITINAGFGNVPNGKDRELWIEPAGDNVF